MEILITGTDGFIGGVLKEYLKQKTNHVIGTAFFREPREDEIKFNITDRSTFDALPAKNFDVVIHTVGIVDQTVGRKKMFEVNSEGTKNILDWLQSHPCKHFIQLSSIAVYGFRTMGQNRTEANTPRYNGRFWIPYGCSKAKAESYIEQAHIPYTILRLPSVMGGNDTFVSQAIIPPLQKDRLYFSSDKNPMFSLLYVKNLGPMIERLIEIGPLNDFFNGTDYSIPWREFVEAYAKKLDIPMHPRKKHILSILWHIDDKPLIYPLINSFFGAHFPNTKLMDKLQLKLPHTWQEGVNDAIETYFKKNQHQMKK